MSTVAKVRDVDSLKKVMADVRSDVPSVNRRSWVVVGHVDGNPNEVDVIAHDASQEASLADVAAHLHDDQVMYCLLRLTTTQDMSTAVKFVYVHWVGDNVPFAKKGRYGVVHGSVAEHFNPHHLLVETGNVLDINEHDLVTRLDETSGVKSKVLEGGMEGRQERGFLSGQGLKKSAGPSVPKTAAPDALLVSSSAELQAAIADVRNDKTTTSWVVAGFQDGDLKKPLVPLATGNGGVAEMREAFDPSHIMFGLFRTSDVIDDIHTVKFVYIYWVGEQVKTMAKAKMSALAGPVEGHFSPYHVSFAFNNTHEISESVIKDKVTASSGSRSFVK